MKATVAISRQTTYDRVGVRAAVRACMDHLGGMAAFVKPGQRVLLKPNILSGLAPERAVTTHPSVVAAVIQVVREAGGQPFIAESPGIGSIDAAARAAGIEAVMREFDVPFGTCTEEQAFDCPENTIMKRIHLLKAVAEADAIISLPKLKTHVQMTFTGAIKNQFGLVYGVAKGQYHFRLQDRMHLAGLFLDINRVVRPVLAIMDAIEGMEGDGPAGGEPRVIGAVMASADLMALDVVACNIIGLDPMAVPTIQAGRLHSAGVTDISAIAIVGETIESVRVPGYKLVSSPADLTRLFPIPSWALRWFRNQWVARPRIIAAKCIKCFACRKGCPVSPPAIDPDRPTSSQVNDHSCIRCYCCHEFCPAKAVALKRSMLDRVFRITRSINWLARKA